MDDPDELPAKPKRKAQPALRSTVPDRVAVRIDGITYLVPADQVEAFRARYERHGRRDARFDV